MQDIDIEMQKIIGYIEKFITFLIILDSIRQIPREEVVGTLRGYENLNLTYVFDVINKGEEFWRSVAEVCCCCKTYELPCLILFNFAPDQYVRAFGICAARGA